jgi:hypothetical protein
MARKDRAKHAIAAIKGVLAVPVFVTAHSAKIPEAMATKVFEVVMVLKMALS